MQLSDFFEFKELLNIKKSGEEVRMNQQPAGTRELGSGARQQPRGSRHLQVRVADTLNAAPPAGRRNFL